VTTAGVTRAVEARLDPDEAELRQRGDQVERLLEEVQAVSGPVAWPRVEALVAALLELYRAGVERTLAQARGAARDARELDRALAADPMVSSLLLLLGLHPMSLEERIDVALRNVRIEVPWAAFLELVGVEDGIAKLRAVERHAAQRPPSTAIVARAVEREAPELLGVQIDGGADAAPSIGLVSVERLLRGGRK
jgi:hypothetical protein